MSLKKQIVLIALLLAITTPLSFVKGRTYTTPMPPTKSQGTPTQTPTATKAPKAKTTDATTKQVESLKKTVLKSIQAQLEKTKSIRKRIQHLFKFGTSEYQQALKLLEQLQNQLELSKEQISKAQTREEIRIQLKASLGKKEEILKELKKLIVLYQRKRVTNGLENKIKNMIEKVEKIYEKLKEKGIKSNKAETLIEEAKQQEDEILNTINQIRNTEDIQTFKDLLQQLKSQLREFKDTLKQIVSELKKAIQDYVKAQEQNQSSQG